MLIVTTIGFDEKFIIRALLRNQVGSGDQMLIFLFEGYEENDKVVTALNSVRSLLENVIREEDFLVVQIPKSDEISVYRNIYRAVKRNIPTDGNILGILSGGMRPLLISILLVLYGITEARVIIESEYENFEGSVRYDLSGIKAPFNEKWLKILLKLRKGSSLRAISRDLGVSLSSISRELKKMREYNLVVPVRTLSRVTGYEVTECGNVYLGIHKTERL